MHNIMKPKKGILVSMKKIGIAIIVTLVVMIILISTLLIILNTSEKGPKQGDIGNVINFDETKIEPVSDNIKFFTIQNCIQNYLDRTNMKSSMYDKEEIDEISISTGIYNLLSKEYIQRNLITKENLLNKIEKVETKLIFVPLKMNYLQLQNTNKYAVYGFCQKLNNEYVKDLYFIVNVDNENKTFSITPLSNQQYESVDKIELNRENIEIELNDNNSYVEQRITDQYLCEQYFLIQKRIMLSTPERAYYYLDEEYRNKRFKTIENYKKYILENKNHIVKMALKEYEVRRTEGNTEYICKDQYNNYYIFNAKEVLNYTVMLDSYTIETEEIKNEYMKKTDRKKVEYNINKWIQMLNNKDYENAYNLLNETFKNKNWNSLEEFRTYMEGNYPINYKIEYNDYQVYGTSHAQKIILKDAEGKNKEQKDITIIMKLNENMNFEMSFNI